MRTEHPLQYVHSRNQSAKLYTCQGRFYTMTEVSLTHVLMLILFRSSAAAVGHTRSESWPDRRIHRKLVQHQQGSITVLTC